VRILHLSWEYPPVVYGGLGRHVHALAEQQAADGHDVVVLTQFDKAVPGDEVRNGVRVIRVPPDAPFVPLDEEHLIAWVASFNSAVTRAGIALARHWRADVVHGHDWLVAHAATAVKDLMQAPYVTTMHATEAGRHQGWLPTELSKTIHGIEWWSTYQARRVIACSEHMRWEVERLFDPPAKKTVVIPNGIDVEQWRVSSRAIHRVREKYGRPLIVFTGRLEWEKGVHTLIDALPRLRRRIPGVRVVIAGRGSTDAQLRDQVRRKRLGRVVTFAGWVPNVHHLMAAADVVVVPSLYEPFGMVALEASAVQSPLVVARTGGLGEIVTDGQTGRTFPPGDVAALADALEETISTPRLARRMARAAFDHVTTGHGWPAISARTTAVYEGAGTDERRMSMQAGLTPRPRIPDGNLLRVVDGA
jgi:glycogen synthase